MEVPVSELVLLSIVYPAKARVNVWNFNNGGGSAVKLLDFF